MAATISVAGYDGSVAGPTGVVEVTQWKADITAEALDATSMSSGGWKEYIIGLQGCTGSLTCQGTAAPARAISALTLKTKSTGGATLTGSALVSKASANVPVDGKVTWDVDFSFTGSVAVT